MQGVVISPWRRGCLAGAGANNGTALPPCLSNPDARIPYPCIELISIWQLKRQSVEAVKLQLTRYAQRIDTNSVISDPLLKQKGLVLVFMWAWSYSILKDLDKKK